MLLTVAEFLSGVGIMLLDIGLGSVQTALIPDPLRARVADKLRLFFVLTPDRVRIVDVIWRDDL